MKNTEKHKFDNNFIKHFNKNSQKTYYFQQKQQNMYK